MLSRHVSLLVVVFFPLTLTFGALPTAEEIATILQLTLYNDSLLQQTHVFNFFLIE